MFTRIPEKGWSESQANNDLGAIDYEMKPNNKMASIRVLRRTDNTYQVNFYEVKDLLQLKNSLVNVKHQVDEVLDHTIVKIYAIHVPNDDINELITELKKHKLISDELATNWLQSVDLPSNPAHELQQRRLK